MPSHRAAGSSRFKLPSFLASLDRKRLAVIGGVTLALVGVLVGLLVTSGSTPTAVRPPTRAPQLGKDRCPLTDEPTSGVPARPALAVKIGNQPPPGGPRPQSGLNEADIVYDTPAEGFIMRYVAVYQCANASSVGPVRSVRWVDWHILRAFLNPILTFAGGIDPDVNVVMGLKWALPANLLESAQAAGHRISSRSAPDNLYTSTAALYGLYPKATAPPPPVFEYTPSLPSSATSASQLAINFSAGTDVLWKWDSASNSWLHTYSGQADVDALTNQPVSTTNIVVQIANYKFGPYSESPGGSGDVESIVQGDGPGYVLRNGKVIPVTWHRRSLVDPTTFTDASGQKVGLAPGRTWVEIVPNTTANSKSGMTITP